MLVDSGSTLRSVIEHKDEDHPHLHFYCIPEQGKQFSSIHKGIEARTKARQQKLSGKQQKLAYCEAMREWQDKFSHDVGQPHGLTRIGPGRRRLTRAEWKKEQQQAKALQQAQSRAKSIDRKTEKRAIEREQEAEEKAKKIAGFGASVGGFFAGVAGKYHKPTQEAEERAKAAEEALETERAKHAKAFDEQRKHYEHELAESESARDDLKQTNKEQKVVLKKYEPHIKAQEEREAREKAAREVEQRRQERERREREAEQRRQQDRGNDFSL